VHPSPSVRRACRLAAACCWLLFSATASHAQISFVIPGVPDANQPPSNALGVPCTQDFSAPIAAADIVAWWDSYPYHSENAAGVAGGLPGGDLAGYLSWFMATNSRRDSACVAGAAHAWGRTSARSGATAGTRNGDVAPGILEYVRWDGGLHPFSGGVSQPPLPSKSAYDWAVKTRLPGPGPSGAYDFLHNLTDQLYLAPVLVTFRHWNLAYLCAEGGIEYYDWLAPVSGTGDPGFHPSYAGGGTPPAEEWNDDNLGHAAAAVGLRMGSRPSCAATTRDFWIIVHDAIPNTATNVAVPLFYDDRQELTWITSSTAISPFTSLDPDVAVDAAGNRHVVWWQTRQNSEEVMYARNPAAGVPIGSGTSIPNGRNPSIAIDPNTGLIAIAYCQAYDLSVQTSSDGGASWSGSVTPGQGGACRKTSIAIDSTSAMHVVWQDGCEFETPCPIEPLLAYVDKPAGGSWGPAREVFPEPSGLYTHRQYDPDLTARGNRLYLVYDHGHGEIAYLEGNVSGGETTWDPDSRRAVNAASGQPVRAPALAVDAGGDVYVAWSDERSGTWQTYHQARRSGSWLPGDLALSAGATAVIAPRIALHSAAGATQVHAAWQQELPAGNYEVATATVVHDGTGGIVGPSPVTNRSATAATSRAPAIAFNEPAAEVDLAWVEQDSVTTLPEPGALGMFAGIAAMGALRAKLRR
jgi:hypothetical protein